MKSIYFQRAGSLFSLATMVGLVWLSVGPASFTGDNGVALAAGDPVIAAAGDVACDPSSSSFNSGNGTSGACRQKYTANILVNGGFAAVLPLGDIQYYCGGYQAWLQSYDLSWGQVKSITRPAVGNHEYLTSGGTDCTSANAGAAGYFKYFGAAAGQPSQGYYSYNVGAWHLIALNSNCSSAGGCGSSSAQGLWLKADLAANRNLCTLAYWHIPLFSSGGRANSNTQALWQILYDNQVEVVLNGHDHIYERFAPQAPNGTADSARGIRQFIVGTGGSNHTSLASIAANSLVRNTDTFGILKLTLHPSSYDWQFVPEAGKTFTDSGTAQCFGSGTPGITNTPLPTSIPSASPTLGTGIATATQGVGDTWPTETFTFNPLADSYVNQSSPTANYGTSTQIRLDGSPFVRSYLRFDVRNLRGRVTRALLRVYANTSLSGGYEVRPVTDTSWGETTINFNNAPAFGNMAGTSGPVIASGWNTIDVTSLINGNGLYSLALNTTSSTALSLVSREGGANQPQLIVESQIPTPTPLPTNTPTATYTSTPTATMTASQTASNTSVAILTQTPTNSPTAINSPSATNTPVPAASATPSPTQTATLTDPPSATATGTQTNTPPPTSVDPPIDTPTPTDTPVPSDTAAVTPTSTPGDPPTDTPTAAATDTETSTPSDPPTDTPIPTVTDTPASAETATSQPTETATDTPLPPATFTSSATALPTLTATASPTQTATNVPIPTNTRTATPLPPPTATMSRTPTRTSTSVPAARTFTPVMDSYVNQSLPTANYGTSTQLRVDGSPLVRSYLRFNVQGLNGPVIRATLRIYASSAATSGCVANIVSNNTWTETALTYNNAPALGSSLGSSGSFGAGVWISMDVTAYITGNGTYNLAVTTAGSTAVSLASREAGANAPQLIIETGP